MVNESCAGIVLYMKQITREKIQDIKYDLLTVPNAMTVGRLASLPFLYRALKRDPAKHWVTAGVIAFSDKGDGWAAKQEDKSERLAELGFRRSATGRIIDPTVDTAFSAALIHAGEQSGAVPRPLSRAAKVQKFSKTLVTLFGTAKREKIEVNYTGKLGEFKTVLGVGLLLGSTGIERPVRRFAARAAAGTITAAGIGMSTVASVDYARQAGILPEAPSQLEERIEAYAETVVRLPEHAINALRGAAPGEHSN